MIELKKLQAGTDGFEAQLDKLLDYDSVQDEAVLESVKEIIQQVRNLGDQALLEITHHFDRWQPGQVSDLLVSTVALEAACERIPKAQYEALQVSAQRIQAFAEVQKQDSWQYQEADGTVLGQRVLPLDRVGIYVPGGKAAYPSSVLMNAIPARVAGVKEIIMCVPTPEGVQNDMVLAAAYIAGVSQVIAIGGAQAIAALAYGTETLPAVDKIVGPGNIYVATAKQLVFGQVGIDMIAGPSEILVVCDGSTDPEWVAMDLCSQAEHDESAQAILIATEQAFLDQVEAILDQQVDTLPRADIVRRSLAERGALIFASDWDQVADIVNRVAPEHLELSMADPAQILPKIRHAGAIFIGRYTSESLGDYCAGPSHVLPTNGTARFSSPLGVYDFQKRSSLIEVSAQGAQKLGQVASVLARGEGLQAHALAAEKRLDSST